MRRLILPLASLLFLAACSSPPPRFSLQNAQAHVRMLAHEIGSRPVGSDANRRARQYLVERLREYGFDVRVQETDAERRGTTTHVANVIATRPGRRAQAIALVSHYDSVPDGPGAADDGLGVAVCLEAGRVLAARPHPNYALALIFTDGEEAGLMGAAAIRKDPIAGWLRAVLNFDAAGSARPGLLFEAGPDSRVLLDAWADAAPQPAGSSYMAEIYKRLPNATDFDLLARDRVPGLNFAAAGDSYAYHTARDTAGRLDPGLVSQLGENTVATVAKLDDAAELSDRDRARTIYIDVAGRWAVTYGMRTALILFAAALLAGLFGWLTVLPVARQAVTVRPGLEPGTYDTARRRPARTLLLTAAWVLVGLVAVFSAMLGAEWLLRATRETYQPWYAHPDRFFLYLALAGIIAGWAFVRIGRLLPPGMRGSTDPAVAWAIILPFWMALAVVAQIVAPSGAHLAVVPLLVAGAGLVLLPSRRRAALRVVSAIVLVVAGTLYVSNALVLLEFMVAALGRAPVVSPLPLYPALMLLFGLLVVPPALALIAAVDWRLSWQNRRGDRAYSAVRLLLVALFVFSAAWCWFAPAYTDDRPLRGAIAYVNDVGAGRARWQIASTEPGAHIGVNAPLTGGWQPGAPPATFGFVVRLPLGPFASYGATALVQPPPLSLTGSLVREQDAAFIEIRAVPGEPGLAVEFNLPDGVVPEETNLAGRQEEGSAFLARYIAVPLAGVTLRARITSDDAGRLESRPDARATVVVVKNGLPGAAWPTLPPWLPQQHVVWHARSYFAMPVPLVRAGGDATPRNSP